MPNQGRIKAESKKNDRLDPSEAESTKRTEKIVESSGDKINALGSNQGRIKVESSRIRVESTIIGRIKVESMLDGKGRIDVESMSNQFRQG